jgi:DEAD/DEAH box helicase domain-containing protein
MAPKEKLFAPFLPAAENEGISPVDEYISSLISAPAFRSQVVHHRVLPGAGARIAPLRVPWPPEMATALTSTGLGKLFSHQAAAIDRVLSGKHTVVATPTASGKTLVYNLPAIYQFLEDPGSRGLYIFPLKALAQDQRRTFESLAALFAEPRPTVAIYDGDTTAWHRKKIRQQPPTVLMTNPEMLHLSLMPFHESWAEFFRGLKLVVIDEVHTYRGVMGSHMAQVFRRLRRICAHYGASPTFIFCSATLGNPDALCAQLTGLPVAAVTDSGAPRGKRHLVLLDPLQGPAKAAISLLKAALHRGLRTIVYAQSRKMTELIALWAANRSGKFADRISAYRAGFLPEERRDIEAKLASGELLAVISTSALELGIDVGNLDLCLLVGYPGTLVSTWQRGGRVGRGGQDAALILIAGEDALDRYFLRHPEKLVSQRPESAVINPVNPDILSRHLPCAAAELPLRMDEPLMEEEGMREAARGLEAEGELLCDASGRVYYARRKRPQRHVDLRGAGGRFRIMSEDTGELAGEIDEFRAYRETHPGAVYLHRGTTFIVTGLDADTRSVRVSPREVDFYTRVMGRKETQIIETTAERGIWGARVATGRLRVTDQVTGYETWRIRGNTVLNRFPLDLPPQVFETRGLWVALPPAVQEAAVREHHHFMGGIHAIEHAAIGIFPILVMTDRNDLGGISTPFHVQVGGPAVFIYDALPGGAGLSAVAFERADELLSHTLAAISSCPCDTGCPACVHSPKCGSGNRPIDKAAAVFLLEKMRALQPAGEMVATGSAAAREDIPSIPASPGLAPRIRHRHRLVRRPPLHYCVFDLETQRSAQEVGGWHRSDRMGISCGVVYDSRRDDYHTYLSHQVPELIAHLRRVDRVIGFNVKRFDYTVLSGYSSFDFGGLDTLDLLESIYRRLGFRLSLDHLAEATLNTRKSGDGLQALRWWKEGRIDEIVAYCRKDVEITKALYGYGRKNGFLLYHNKAGQTVRVSVKW